MTDLLFAVLLWVKAFHVIAVIAWMAGLLYLPRLFVNHCEVESEGPGWKKGSRASSCSPP